MRPVEGIEKHRLAAIRDLAVSKQTRNIIDAFINL